MTVEVHQETTDEVSAKMMANTMQVGNATAANPDADVFLDKVAEKLAKRVNGNGGNGGGGRKFLGLTGGDWTKMVIAWTVATAVFVGTWYRTVNHGLQERPTTTAVAESIEKHNTGPPHPRAAKRLKQLESEQRVIRESQIRAEEVDKQQTEVLREIKIDVRRIRRGR